MDPVSLIVAALAAGAVAGTQGAATEVVRDAYSGLKALVGRRLAGRPAGEVAVEGLESEPEAWRGVLEAELVEVGAGQDGVMVAAAERLLAVLDAAGVGAGKYRVDVRGGQGVQIGEQNTMTNTFTTPPAS